MIELFEFYDSTGNEKIFQTYPELKINKSPEFYLLLRGLTGTLKIKQLFRDETFEQSINYLDQSYEHINQFEKGYNEEHLFEEGLQQAFEELFIELRKKCKSNLEIIPQYISDSFSLKDLSETITNKDLIRRNKSFFETLNNEFCNFYYFTYKENHTVAFLHLYRILEYVSYTFPLMYAASTKDFSKSFDSLKGLFSGDKDQGELKVFKFFIQNVMSIEKNYKGLTIDINIISELDDYNERIYNTLLSICDKSIFEEVKNIENKRLCIKFSEFSSFIITIRNRFFHLKNSQSTNIHSIDIVDSDFFFNLINRKCAYFLSLVTVLIINKSYFQK
ncbi:MAG: hypothetical protein ACOVNP_08005 [Flavobacterium sp.]